jgi:Myristoyl-CoA:protein N-myristoyltransferase, N-terminal domain
MTDRDTVAQVHDLLARNYVEDDDEMFRWDSMQHKLIARATASPCTFSAERDGAC